MVEISVRTDPWYTNSSSRNPARTNLAYFRFSVQSFGWGIGFGQHKTAHIHTQFPYVPPQNRSVWQRTPDATALPWCRILCDDGIRASNKVMECWELLVPCNQPYSCSVRSHSASFQFQHSPCTGCGCRRDVATSPTTSGVWCAMPSVNARCRYSWSSCLPRFAVGAVTPSHRTRTSRPPSWTLSCCCLRGSRSRLVLRHSALAEISQSPERIWDTLNLLNGHRRERDRSV